MGDIPNGASEGRSPAVLSIPHMFDQTPSTDHINAACMALTPWFTAGQPQGTQTHLQLESNFSHLTTVKGRKISLWMLPCPFLPTCWNICVAGCHTGTGGTAAGRDPPPPLGCHFRQTPLNNASGQGCWRAPLWSIPGARCTGQWQHTWQLQQRLVSEKP